MPPTYVLVKKSKARISKDKFYYKEERGSIIRKDRIYENYGKMGKKKSQAEHSSCYMTSNW